LSASPIFSTEVVKFSITESSFSRKVTSRHCYGIISLIDLGRARTGKSLTEGAKEKG
jgi:hypothetical protein